MRCFETKSGGAEAFWYRMGPDLIENETANQMRLSVSRSRLSRRLWGTMTVMPTERLSEFDDSGTYERFALAMSLAGGRTSLDSINSRMSPLLDPRTIS